jgi:alkylation response protein AidB-like acyl-CoA dehydrogenase
MVSQLNDDAAANVYERTGSNYLNPISRPNHNESEGRQRKMLRLVSDMIPEMWTRAAALDREPRFPTDEFDRLRAIGALSSIVPQSHEGMGLGIGENGNLSLLELLRLLGRGNLAVGRIFEGHVNAFQLLMLYGNAEQKECAIADVRSGHVFAIWIADGSDPVRLVDSATPSLAGRKIFCSGAGHATRALITARAKDGIRMLCLPVPIGVDEPTGGSLPHGMRASVTSGFNFDGFQVPRNSRIGCPGDYLREPAFSGGAWRTAAVTLGGLDALLGETGKQLMGRERHQNPHQLLRMGQAFVAHETAQLWIRKAAVTAGSIDQSPASIAAYVNLARTAIEGIVLDVIRIVQRCLGLAAFIGSNPVERLMRDLATYVRQPAPDEALAEAAAWRFEHDFPESDTSL